MNEELYWLVLTAGMTGLFWMPYILNRMAVLGIVGTLANPKSGATMQSPWADRAQAAHGNAVQNLVVFASLVLALQALNISTSLTVLASMSYFFLRLAHYIVYSIGIPGLRTLLFIAGWVAQMAIFVEILSKMGPSV